MGSRIHLGLQIQLFLGKKCLACGMRMDLRGPYAEYVIFQWRIILMARGVPCELSSFLSLNHTLEYWMCFWVLSSKGPKTQNNTKWVNSNNNTCTARQPHYPYGLEKHPRWPPYTGWPFPAGWLWDKSSLLQPLCGGQVLPLSRASVIFFIK